jgi:hypothetical protein
VIPETRQDGWVELDAGGCVLALHAVPADVAKDIAIANPPDPRSGTPIKLVFETADLSGAGAHLTSCGATMREPYAFGACDGLDPEGNVFQIVQR